MSAPKVTTLTERAPTLAEAQVIVTGSTNGTVALIRLANGDQMLVDENGSYKPGLPINVRASKLARQTLVGPVLILRGKARWT